MPPVATKSKYGKISKSQILTPPNPQGHGMSVKFEKPLDELTVQVWLLYDHPRFKYCTLFISGTELRTDRQTDRQTDGRTDDPNTKYPWRTFQAGGIKNKLSPNWNSSEVFIQPKRHQILDILIIWHSIKIFIWLSKIKLSKFTNTFTCSLIILTMYIFISFLFMFFSRGEITRILTNLNF